MTRSSHVKDLEVTCPELIPDKVKSINRKKETRRNRQQDLELLRLAQKVYKIRTGHKNIKGTDMNRTKLNKIREEIKQYYKQHPGTSFPIK